MPILPLDHPEPLAATLGVMLSGQAKVIGLLRVGGLQHRYVWAEAA
jgi:hypothetical protein